MASLRAPLAERTGSSRRVSRAARPVNGASLLTTSNRRRFTASYLGSGASGAEGVVKEAFICSSLSRRRQVDLVSCYGCRPYRAPCADVLSRGLLWQGGEREMDERATRVPGRKNTRPEYIHGSAGRNGRQVPPTFRPIAPPLWTHRPVGAAGQSKSAEFCMINRKK